MFYQCCCPSKPHGAAPRNPIVLCLETPAPPLETPWCCASKPQVRRASKPLGTKFEAKIFKFRWFLGPSDQNEPYHTPLLSKIGDLGDRKFFGGDSRKCTRATIHLPILGAAQMPKIGAKLSLVCHKCPNLGNRIFDLSELCHRLEQL